MGLIAAELWNKLIKYPAGKCNDKSQIAGQGHNRKVRNPHREIVHLINYSR